MSGALSLSVLQIEELVTLVWCLDSLGHQDQGLFEAVARKMVECIQEREGLPAGNKGDRGTSSSSSDEGMSIDRYTGRSRGGGNSHASSRSDGALVVEGTVKGAVGNVLGQSPVQQQQREGRQQQQYVSQQEAVCRELGYSGGLGLEIGVQGGEGLAAWRAVGLSKRSYDVLERYDPFLCVMVLYRDFFGGAWSLG
jgi:hypothetical protein